MQHVIKVGRKNYTIALIPGKLFFNGEQVDAMCHHDRAEIQVSDAVPLEHRMIVAADAVSHAWSESIREQDR